MTKLILIRHGQSEANFCRIYTGQSDIPLTDLGRMQAATAARYIKENESISAVYASPLIRAFETGRIVAEENAVPIYPCEGLMEINAGAWEGKRFDELEMLYPENYGTWRHDIGRCRPDGGESVAELFERCLEAVEKIILDNPDRTVVLATHATPIRALSGYWSGLAIENLRDIPWSANASLTHIFYERSKGYYGFKTNICEHLKGIETKLPDNV